VLLNVSALIVVMCVLILWALWQSRRGSRTPEP